MNNNHLPLSIFKINLYIVLIFSPVIIISQSHINLISTFEIPRGKTGFLIDNSLGYWDAQNLSISAKSFPVANNETIHNCFPFVSEKNNNILTISSRRSVKKNKNLLHYRIWNSEGNLLTEWTQERVTDVGIPGTFISSKGSIIFSYPETQTYQIFNLQGEELCRAALFKNTNRDHEKTMIIKELPAGKILIAGMKSANPVKPDNVQIFELNDDFSPDYKLSLQLNMLYHFELSNSGIIAVVGTIPDNNRSIQKVSIIFIDKNYRMLNNSLELSAIPRYLQWHKNQLLLIFVDHIMVIDPANPEENRSKKISRIIPIGIHISENSLFILAGNQIRYNEYGFMYTGVSLIEYDLKSTSLYVHQISSESHSLVRLLSNEDSKSLTIQMDNNIHTYKVN